MDKWQPIETAPKSTSEDVPGGKRVTGVFLLGYCPQGAVDPMSEIEVIWWEPNENDGAGCWYADGLPCAPGAEPTHWMPLPTPPTPTPLEERG